MTTLITDTISDCIKIGVYEDGVKLFSIEKKGMALENFFDLLSDVCTGAKVKTSQIDELIFCEGTGSVLGIRTASVAFFTIAFLTKAKVYSYKIFDIAAFLCRKKKAENCQIICDSKKAFYNVLKLEDNTYSAPQEISYEEFETIKTDKIFYLKQREKQVVKEEFEELPYSIDDIFEAINSDRNFYLEEQSEVKDALLLTKREFVKWNSKADI